MDTMKQNKPAVTKDAKRERERQRKDPAGQNDKPARPETDARARELAERHRETLDYLSKN